jgi:all-trans-retinol 13,14-reductase
MDKQPVAISYRQHALDEAWDAIVIGSGIGGLTAAAVLARHAGKRVLVLERHYEPGGFTHVFHRPGYEWDVGVHYVGEVHDPRSELRRILDALTGGRLEWQRMPDVYDRAHIGDREYEFVSGRERFRDRMKQYFPAEARAVDGYLDAVDEAARAGVTYLAEKVVPAPIARVAGALMRRGFLRYASRTTGDVLAGLGASPELTGCLTAQWGDYGLPPAESSFGIHAIIAAHYLEGASYPVGGASRIAATLAPAIHDAGGCVVTSAEVAGVVLDRHRRVAGVRMADGREFRAPLVVSDAGAGNTFGRLLPPDAPGVEAIRAELASVSPSLAHLCLYVGLRASSASLGLPAANLWVHATADHDAGLARLSDDPGAPFSSVFISSPSAKDPLFEQRHPGHSTMEVVTLAPWCWFEKWKETRWKRRGAGYDEWKREMAERLTAELVRHVPAVTGWIDYAELSTPLSTRHFANHAHGEIYGLEATPARFRMRGLRAATPVHGLYLTGADLAAPGVAGGTYGGVLAASAILGRNMIRVVAGSKPLAREATAAAA